MPHPDPGPVCGSFPIASPDDFAAVRQIADTVGNEENPPIICGLARATTQDINTCVSVLSLRSNEPFSTNP